VAEYKETHVTKAESGEKSSANAWLAFLVGALLIAVVAVFLMNAHGRVTGPAGSIDLNVKSPIQTPATPAPAKAK
jgi:hypothetical protein